MEMFVESLTLPAPSKTSTRLLLEHHKLAQLVVFNPANAARSAARRQDATAKAHDEAPLMVELMECSRADVLWTMLPALSARRYHCSTLAKTKNRCPCLNNYVKKPMPSSSATRRFVVFLAYVFSAEVRCDVGFLKAFP